MTETLHYGIEQTGRKTRMFLDVPSDINQTIHEKDRQLTDQIRAMEVKSRRYIELRQSVDSKAIRLLIDSRKIGSIENQIQRETVAGTVTEMLNSIDTWADPAHKDPSLKVRFSAEPMYGVVPLKSQILWPKGDQDDIIGSAEGFMEGTAKNLRLDNNNNFLLKPSGPHKASLLFNEPIDPKVAVFNSERLNGWFNDLEKVLPTEVEIDAPDIRSHLEQLVVFSGLIAISKSGYIHTNDR